MGATQWRPGVLRALQDVFREGKEGDQVPYIHALDLITLICAVS